MAVFVRAFTVLQCDMFAVGLEPPHSHPPPPLFIFFCGSNTVFLLPEVVGCCLIIKYKW